MWGNYSLSRIVMLRIGRQRRGIIDKAIMFVALLRHIAILLGPGIDELVFMKIECDRNACRVRPREGQKRGQIEHIRCYNHIRAGLALEILARQRDSPAVHAPFPELSLQAEDINLQPAERLISLRPLRMRSGEIRLNEE